MKVLNNLKKAFTLIELMIVVGIIGIIASIAIPQYADYQKGVIMSSLIFAVDQKKTEIVLCYQKTSSFDNCDYTPSQLSQFITRNEVNVFTIEDGVITIEFDIKDELGINYGVILKPVLQSGVLVYFSENGNYCDHEQIRCDRRI